MANDQSDLNVEIGVSLTRLAAQLARAEARFASATKKIERDTSAGAQRAGDAMANSYARGVAQAAAQTDRLNAAVTRVNGSVGRSGGAIQNFSYQIGDFAVQVGAGTSAAQALAQQLPQLLGGFGVMGAVMGAVVAIAIPLGRALFDVSGTAKTLDQAIADVNSSIAALNDVAAQSSAEGMEELRSKYGQLTSDVLALIAAQAELAQQDAVRRMAETFAAMDGFLGDGMLSTRFGELSEIFGVTGREVAGLSAGLESLRDIDSFEQQADAAARFRGMILEAAGSLDNMTDQQYQLYSALVDAENAARELAAASSEAAESMLDGANAAQVALEYIDAMSGGLGAASSAASGLAGNMWDAANAAMAAARNIASAMAARVAARTSSAQVAIPLDAAAAQYAQYGAGRQAFDQGAAEQRYSVENQFPGYVPPSMGGGRSGGGSGGGGAAVDHAAEFNRLLAALDPLIRAQQEFDEAQRTINEALETGAASAEQAAHAYDLAQEKFQEATGALVEGQNAWRQLEDIGGDALDRLIDGTGDWRDVLLDAIKQFAKARLQQSLLGSVTGGQAGDSIGTLLMRGLFGGFRANGGPVSPGKAYMVGERGPEMIVPRAPGSVVPNAALSGRGSAVRVIGGDLVLNDSGQIMARVQVVAAGAGQAAVRHVEQNLGATINKLQRDGRI